jgi:hypothetical protein
LVASLITVITVRPLLASTSKRRLRLRLLMSSFKRSTALATSTTGGAGGRAAGNLSPLVAAALPLGATLPLLATRMRESGAAARANVPVIAAKFPTMAATWVPFGAEALMRAGRHATVPPLSTSAQSLAGSLPRLTISFT